MLMNILRAPIAPEFLDQHEQSLLEIQAAARPLLGRRSGLATPLDPSIVRIR